VAAIADRMTHAFQAQQRGELRSATESFLSILRDEPDNVNALQLLGLIHLNAGRLVEADQLISRAIELCPLVPELHNNRGLCRMRQERLKEAESDFLQAIRLKPAYPEAFNNLGLAIGGLGRPADAETAFIRAIKLQPNFPAAFNNLAATVLKEGRAANAVSCCRKAIELRSVYPEAELTLGLALEQLGRFDEAESCFRRSLAAQPHHQTWTGLGRLLRNSERAIEAERCFRAALELAGDSSEAFRELGFVLLEQGKLDEAGAAARKAHEYGPDAAEGHRLLGCIFRERGDLQQAEACYLRAVELDRDNAEAHLDLAKLHLLTERWKTGWKGYEWRWRCPHAPRLHFEQPVWDGASLDGKSILIWCEAADENTLQFARYVSLVKARGGRVIFRSPITFGSLFRADYIGADRVIVEDQPLPAFDTHAPLASLPGIFGTLPDAVPAAAPYIPQFEFDAVTWSFWQERLEQFAGEKVGIVWGAGRSDGGSRTINPSFFASLGSIPGISLISLEKGVSSSEVPRGIGCLDSAFDEATWVDMAAVVSGLDLIITVDSPVAHLAGTQNIPVWTVLSFIPDWRWQLGREDCPWYPTMRLFRQPEPGNWVAVFKQLGLELDRWARTRVGLGKRNHGGIDFTGSIRLDGL
jgi:Flp pilus assembly protein TadD